MKMKTVLIIVGLIAVLVILISCFKKSNESVMTTGYAKDIERNIQKLMNSRRSDAFLIVTIFKSDDYIQFTADAKGVQLNLPLITERQKSFESLFKKTAESENLNVIESKGTDGTIFLDINIDGASAEISKTVESFMAKLFNVSANTKLKFELNV